jgi:hypothetical protein
MGSGGEAYDPRRAGFFVGRRPWVFVLGRLLSLVVLKRTHGLARGRQRRRERR